MFIIQHSDHNETHKYVLNEIKKVKTETPEETILVLSPVRYYMPEFINVLNENSIEYVDFWTNQIDPKLQEKIWWLKAIYSRHKILFLLFLSKKLTSNKRNKLLKILLQALKENFDEEKLIHEFTAKKIYQQPFSDYLINPPIIEEFIKTHEDFLILKDHIDGENLIDSLKKIERSINPITEFNPQAVNILSIHKSKGLQADHVFLLGLTEGVLPNETKGLDSIEAQRRLLFVGMTRALKTLYLISTIAWDGRYVNKVDKKQFKYRYQNRIWYGKTSRFVEEIK